MKSVFGISANTTHDFALDSVQGKIYQYQCGCRRHPLTIRRHNKIQRNQTSYSCKVCQQTLIYVES